jgi:hypothetical protein
VRKWKKQPEELKSENWRGGFTRRAIFGLLTVMARKFIATAYKRATQMTPVRPSHGVDILF